MANLEAIVSLCKRRGFIFPGSEIYGGLAGTWDLGPLGAELAHNIKEFWWNHFVQRHAENYGLASS
ncbi:MAG: glycine--tRNA ligase, partial [Patescibacteria group bacterium]